MRCLPLFVIACLLCGVVTAPAWAQQLQCSPCRHGFNKVLIGNSGSFSFELSNTGSKSVRIASILVQGSPFSFGDFPLPAHINPGASVQLTAIFTPMALGYTSGSLTIRSNAVDSSLELNVEGDGVADTSSQLEVTPATLNFGNVTVGSSATQQATLTAANGAVTITSDRTTNPEFAILGLDLPITIQAGQNLPVTIQFAPGTSGTGSGKAGFISNAQNSPTIEQLTGTGVPAGSHSVDLSWVPGDGNAVGYNVYRGTANGGPYQIINNALDASTSYTDETVASGTTYFYVVTEVNAEGQQSAYSNVAKAVIPGS